MASVNVDSNQYLQCNSPAPESMYKGMCNPTSPDGNKVLHISYMTLPKGSQYLQQSLFVPQHLDLQKHLQHDII